VKTTTNTNPQIAQDRRTVLKDQTRSLDELNNLSGRLYSLLLQEAQDALGAAGLYALDPLNWERFRQKQDTP